MFTQSKPNVCFDRGVRLNIPFKPVVVVGRQFKGQQLDLRGQAGHEEIGFESNDALCKRPGVLVGTGCEEISLMPAQREQIHHESFMLTRAHDRLDRARSRSKFSFHAGVGMAAAAVQGRQFEKAGFVLSHARFNRSGELHVVRMPHNTIATGVRSGRARTSVRRPAASRD